MNTIVYGPPASGKTLLANELSRRYLTKGESVIVVDDSRNINKYPGHPAKCQMCGCLALTEHNPTAHFIGVVQDVNDLFPGAFQKADVLIRCFRHDRKQTGKNSKESVQYEVWGREFTKNSFGFWNSRDVVLRGRR